MIGKSGKIKRLCSVKNEVERRFCCGCVKNVVEKDGEGVMEGAGFLITLLTQLLTCRRCRFCFIKFRAVREGMESKPG